MNLEQFTSTINKYASDHLPFIFLIDFEMKKPYICRLADAASEDVFYDIKGNSNLKSERVTTPISIEKRFPVSKKHYATAFEKIQDNLHGGNTYLINLTFSTEIETSSDLSGIYSAAAAPYKLLFKDRFVLFSPECFIRIEQGKIYSYPMKGTINASIPNAQEVILADLKESWEHNTIVDLIRNDISIVSESVSVNRFRFIDRITTPEKDLLQVSSEISGILPDDWRQNLGELLMKLLPAGSISGAPKKKTVEIIEGAEDGPRGYYTGIFGVFDGENLDSAVNIRFIEKKDGSLFFRSGGGITANSEFENEYQEMIDKVNVPSNS